MAGRGRPGREGIGRTGGSEPDGSGGGRGGGGVVVVVVGPGERGGFRYLTFSRVAVESEKTLDDSRRRFRHF